MNIRRSLAIGVLSIIVIDVHASNVVFNGDFSVGNNGFATEYTLGDLTPDGEYGVFTAGENTGSLFGPAPADHTSGDGQMFLANGATSNKLVWGQDVAVQQNTIYDFSMWAMTLSIGNGGNNSDLEVLINGSPIGPVFGTPFQFVSPWVNFTAQWSSDNNNVAEIAIFERSLEPSGNDFGLDDISLTAVPLPATLPLFFSAIGLFSALGVRNRRKMNP